jgi:hypothetical protein
VQWQVSTNGDSTFTNIGGAVSTTLSFTTSTADNRKQYRAVFTNSTGSATTNAATLTVNTATKVTLTSSRNTSTYGQSVVFTATVTLMTANTSAASAKRDVTPTGTVTFKDGTTVLGTTSLNANGVATFTTTSLSVGSHNITAEYNGDSSLTGSISNVLVQIVQKGAPVEGELKYYFPFIGR